MIRNMIGKFFRRSVLVAVLVLAAYAYALRTPAVREMADAKLPVLKDINARILALWSQGNNPSESPIATVEMPTAARPMRMTRAGPMRSATADMPPNR